MAPDEYSTAISGGLKLKGVNPSSKISKHKKRKPKAESDPSIDSTKNSKTPKDETSKPTDLSSEDKAISKETLEDETPESRDSALQEDHPPKTEAELRHEERRRKRLDERLKREGTKTHKERVEELNRYLSNLSEHHDMPRIGPG
ncbi:hypothetical protein ACLMJK_006840 [Lecanora helva]